MYVYFMSYQSFVFLPWSSHSKMVQAFFPTLSQPLSLSAFPSRVGAAPTAISVITPFFPSFGIKWSGGEGNQLDIFLLCVFTLAISRDVSWWWYPSPFYASLRYICPCFSWGVRPFSRVHATIWLDLFMIPAITAPAAYPALFSKDDNCLCCPSLYYVSWW